MDGIETRGLYIERAFTLQYGAFVFLSRRGVVVVPETVLIYQAWRFLMAIVRY